MRFYFDAMRETKTENFKGGEGFIFIKKGMYDNNMIMQLRLPRGSSIGLHKHENNTETFFVVSGKGMAICDGVEEGLVPGVIHVCKKGSTHTLVSTGEEDLVLYSSVTEC